jgi:hypothetical protein
VQIRGNGTKLTRAFFYLLEYLLRSSGASLSVYVRQTNGQQVQIRITSYGVVSSVASTVDFSEPIAAGELEIARRTFRAVGGDLAFSKSASGQRIWIANLPLAG